MTCLNNSLKPKLISLLSVWVSMQPRVHFRGSKHTTQTRPSKKKRGFGVWVGGRTLRARFGLKEGGGFKVPAKVSPAGGGVSARRDSRSSEVWQSVSGYSCRSAMITLHSHSTALIYSNPHRNLTKSASHTRRTNTHRHTHKHRHQQP